jgi:hypothetical protein
VGTTLPKQAVYFSPPQLSSHVCIRALALCTCYKCKLCFGMLSGMSPAACCTQQFIGRVAEHCPTTHFNLDWQDHLDQGGAAKPLRCTTPCQLAECGTARLYRTVTKSMGLPAELPDNCRIQNITYRKHTGDTVGKYLEYQDMLGGLLEVYIIHKYINFPACENIQLGLQGHNTKGCHPHWVCLCSAHIC